MMRPPSTPPPAWDPNPPRPYIPAPWSSRTKVILLVIVILAVLAVAVAAWVSVANSLDGLVIN